MLSPRTFKQLKQAVTKRIKVPASQEHAGRIALYTEAMMRELDANMYKGDYHKLDSVALLIELQKHLDKLRLTAQYRPLDKTRILEYSADLGNLAFMLADVHGALTSEVQEKREKESDFVAQVHISSAGS